jgi:O-antigen/teichoic acid export membrane protein
MRQALATKFADFLSNGAGDQDDTTLATGLAAQSGLRRSAMRGGIYLIGRQVVSVMLKFIGVMLITRVLGPEAYGAYVSALNISQYAAMFGLAGVGVCLLRYEGNVSDEVYRTAYTILAALSLLLVVLLEAVTATLSHWVDVTGFEIVMHIMVLAVPFQLLAVPASVRLERCLDYRRVALLEIVGQGAFYALAIPLVTMEFGPASLAIAWLLQQAVSCLAAHLMTRTRPRFGLDRATARGIARYAMNFSVASWIWQLRMLVNPLVVGPALGAQAVGLIGMTIGILEMLSIIKTVAWRLSVAVLRDFHSNAGKLRRAITEGMELQLLAVGTILLGFAWTGHIIVPWLFGERWAAVMDIYPYVALSYLTISPFNMHSAVLSVINRNQDLIIYHILHIAIFAGVAVFAVRAFGLIGYGYAEVATIPVYIVMHVLLARAIGSPDYRLALLWWAAVAAGLFWAQIGIWTVALPFLALLTPRSRRRLVEVYRLTLRRH